MSERVSVFDLLDGPKVVFVRPETSANVIGINLNDETILELWNERSAILESENRDYADWLDDRGEYDRLLVRRHAELCAAAELSLTYGDYVESVIRPQLTQIPSA